MAAPDRSAIVPEEDAPPPLSRRERRKLEVRTRILEASVGLFEERGIDETTVIEICALADVAQKTFFNHFQSKRELLREIAKDGLEQLLLNIEEARKRPGSTAGRIEFFFERIAGNALEAGPMHRELLSEIVRVSHEGSEPEQAQRLQDAFGGIVREGIAMGDVTRRHSVETLTEMLIGAYYVLLFNWANLPAYPLHERALLTARFLTEAFAPGADECGRGTRAGKGGRQGERQEADECKEEHRA